MIVVKRVLGYFKEQGNRCVNAVVFNQMYHLRLSKIKKANRFLQKKALLGLLILSEILEMKIKVYSPLFTKTICVLSALTIFLRKSTHSL